MRAAFLHKKELPLRRSSAAYIRKIQNRRFCPPFCKAAKSPVFLCAPGGARFSRVQVPSLPGSGKDIAEGKGVHREVESEGNRMREPTNPRANLWSDEQKSHIRLYMRVSLHNKIKPDSYTESCAVNTADGWRERNVWYPGRSV